MKKPLGKEMEFFRQYDEALFNQLEKKILDLEKANQQFKILVKEYQSQFENISDVVFIISTDFNILSVSSSVEKLLGYKAEYFIGRPATDLRHIFTSESFERAIAQISKMLKGIRIPISTYTFVARDGTLKHIEIHGSPLMRDGQVAGTISVARDVTERIEAEEALRESEFLLASIYNTVGAAIFHLAVEPAEQFRFISVNDAFLKITGFSREMVVGKTVNDLIPEPSLTMFLEKYRQAIAEKTIVRWEVTSDYPSGRLTGAVSISPVLNDRGTCFHLVGSFQDITEHMRAEEALRESEAKYRHLYNNVPAAIYKVDFKTQKLLEVNDVFYKYLGFSKEEITSLSPYDLLTEESRKLFMERVEKMTRGIEVPTAVEYEIFNKKGERLWMRLDNDYIYDTEGQVIAANVVAHDITERKKAESEKEAALEALQKSEDKYRALIETTDTGYVIIDQDGLVRDANSEYVRLTGYHDLSEIVGRSVLQWTAESEKEKNAESVKACFDKGLTRNLEINYVDSKGNVTPIEINGTCIEIEGKTYTITICRDITDRKQAEKKLRESDERFRSMIQSLSDMIFILDGNGRLTYESPSVARILGYPSGYFIGKSPFTHIHPDDLDQVMKDMEEVFLSVNDGIPTEFRFQKADDTWGYLEALGNNQLENPCIRGIVLTLRDTTARKKTEEKIRTSLREKDILISEIHHRVKNNLQVISSLVGLQARSSGNPELTKMFNGIQDRIQSMAMIHETLYDTKDFSRIELSRYVHALSQSLFNTHNINPGKIELTILTDGPVYVDITKAIPCGLVLNELICNALKHAFPRRRKGNLQIIISETKKAKIAIVVRDNGAGLPDNIDILKPQTLGLELVNGLVKNQLNGQIKVRRDNGTEMRIIFPV